MDGTSCFIGLTASNSNDIISDGDVMNYIYDAERSIPKHQLITADLGNKINNGFYPEGSLLPGEFELAKIYSASRNTIRTALSALESSFRIQRIQGKGTVVLSRVDPTNKSEFASRGFSNYLRSNYGGGSNNEVHTKTLVKKFVPCPEKLQPSFPDYVANGNVICYERVYYANGDPVAVVVSFIQTQDLNCIEQYDFEMVSLATAIRTMGIEFRYRQGYAKAVSADAETAAILNISENHPLIRYRYETYGANMPGVPTLEVGTIYLKTDNVTFIVSSFQ